MIPGPRRLVLRIYLVTTAQVLAILLAVAVVEAERVTLWVEAVGSAEDREHQSEVVRLVNEARLRVQGSALRVRIRDREGKSQVLRVSG